MKEGGRVARRVGCCPLCPLRGDTLPKTNRCYYSNLATATSSYIEQSRAKRPSRRPNGYWLKVENQRKLFEAVGHELGVEDLSDWYKIPRQQVVERGGKFLLSLYPSLARALMDAYPSYPWDMTKFIEAGNTPRDYWQQERNLTAFLAYAEGKLGIKEPKDWHSVMMVDLRQIGLSSRVTKMKLIESLSKRYPQHNWDKMYMLRGKYSHQRRLELTVASLFPGYDVKINARKEAQLINPATGDYLELDIYVPSLNIAFEYQERHHFVAARYFYEPLEAIQARDNMKLQLAKNKGITLIQVPCWWDGHKDSLIATINQKRPDLQLIPSGKEAKPIPTTMPEDFIQRHENYVTDIGNPMTACFLTQMSTDPTNWWMFEKYDGLRAFWNPLKGSLYSRLNNTLNVPPEVIQELPSDTFLDGELWFGRDTFQEASKIANRSDPSLIDWNNFKYMVFDAPLYPGTYEERYNHLVSLLGSKECKYVQLAPKSVCEGMPHLEQFFQETINEGGEGIILRDPHSVTTPGRSKGYLKHKKFRDAEARIIGKSGPHWECELPNGVTFTASPGTNEFLKTWSPQPGDIVSFRHSGFLEGSKKPKFPLLYRLRPDLTWDSVVTNWKDNTSSATLPSLPRRSKTKHKKKGFWRDPENRKKVLFKFAEENGFDPLQPHNWTPKRVSLLSRTKEAKILINKYGTLQTAIQETLPELNLQLQSTKKPNHYWKDLNNVRRFFDEVAASKGFNPTTAERWSTISSKEILKKQGGWSIQEEYKGLRTALKKAYPEVRFAMWE